MPKEGYLIGKQAVAHRASLLRWIWSISECNLMTRDSTNTQSRTHIDPKVGTDGSHVCWLYLSPERRLPLAHSAHATWSLPGEREKSGTCLQCVWQRSTRSIETQMVFQCDPMDFISWYNPSEAYTVKHVSYPRLTATRGLYGMIPEHTNMLYLILN